MRFCDISVSFLQGTTAHCGPTTRPNSYDGKRFPPSAAAKTSPVSYMNGACFLLQQLVFSAFYLPCSQTFFHYCFLHNVSSFIRRSFKSSFLRIAAREPGHLGLFRPWELITLPWCTYRNLPRHFFPFFLAPKTFQLSRMCRILTLQLINHNEKRLQFPNCWIKFYHFFSLSMAYEKTHFGFIQKHIDEQ